MLHILLMILKIIGIVLAVIIGIFLAVLICVLFIPVRYCIRAEGKLGEEVPIRLEIKITWLMHAVNIAFSYSKSACLRLRIFCFTIFDSSKKKQLTGKKKKEADEEPGAEDGGEQTGTEQTKADAETIEDKKNREPEYLENKGTGILEENKKTDRDETKEDTAAEGSSKIKDFLEAFRLFFRKLLDAVENIEYTIQKICGKIRSVMENIRYYVNILQGEAFKKVFRNGKCQLFGILRSVRPKKCRINLTVGMEDPSGTGQIMAFYGMLYPFVGNNVSVQADFEEKIMEGDLYIKGKVTAVVFLIAAIRLFMDKNIWKLIKLLKKEGA